MCVATTDENKKDNDLYTSDGGTVQENIDNDGSDEVSLLLKQDDQAILVEPKDRLRNLITALSLTGLMFIAKAASDDTYSQYLYYRFQDQVLGANYSKLNVSTAKDPCIDTNSSTNEFSKQLDEAQSLTSDFITRTTMLSYVPAIITILLFGSYCDYIGRKIFFIVPVTGFLINLTLFWAICFWKLQLELFYIGFAITGVTGSVGTLCMALYTYTADNTDQTNTRSFGMVVAMATSEGMSSISHVVNGHIITQFGYTWASATTAVLSLIALLGIVVFVRETLHRNRNIPCLRLTEGVKSIFSFYVMECPDKQHKRKDFMLLTAIFVLYTISIGPSIDVLFFMDRPLCWNAAQVGYIRTAQGLVQCMAPVILLKLLQKCMTDELVCLLSLVSALAYYLTFSFAHNPWMIYVGIAVGFMQNSVQSLLRAILSRMVVATKRGSLLSSLAVTEVATVAASGACLTKVYSLSVSYWSGFTYFIISMFILIGAVVLIVFIFMEKRRKSYHQYQSMK